ncbi:MAG: hypothetical protein ACTHMM_26845 [Agriterribacter sp.]
MNKLFQMMLSAVIIFPLGCNQQGNSIYAIRDFKKTLQPHLIEVVSKGIVTYDSCISNVMTDKEIVQLSRCEHPVLRAMAFREMLDRNSFNHFDIVMNNLTDTAIVATDAGEFGIWYRRISDDILQKALWKTEEAKNKTIEKVLTKHNYLRAAYLILLQIEPQEKYYTFIKEMATRPRRLSYEGYELEFDDIELALFGLARFKKPEDIVVIRQKLLDNVSQLSEVSFRLMREYPDAAYFDVLQDYHRWRFYRFSGEGRHGFTGNDDNRAGAMDFIEALVRQQSEKSARLLDTILQRMPAITCVSGKDFIEDQMVMEIWEHPNPAYEKL